MLYKSLYSGPKIDELLEAIGNIRKVDNGWVKLTSTEDEPIDFNDLINPGNYSFDYWINSPEGKDYPTPVKAVVTQEGDIIRQYIFSLGYNDCAYYRIYNQTTKEFGSWIDKSLIPGLTVGDTAPENPEPNNIWINTSNKDAVVQYFDGTTNSWQSLNPEDYMDTSIYNSTGLMFENGIYNWIIERTTNITGGDNPVDFTDHIEDSTIHLTVSEKADIDSKPTKSELIDALNKLADELVQLIVNQTSKTGIDMSTYEILINNLMESLLVHESDLVKHPNTEQITDWGSKSDANHTHTPDEIQIDISDIVGEYTMDMLPDNIKERQVQVNNESELLSLSIKDVQNGDFVYVISIEDGELESSTNMLYVVVDDTKLGTIDAYKCLSTPPREVTWDEVNNKPTTLDELDVEYITNDYIDDKISALQKLVDTTTEDLESVETAIGLIDQKSYSHYMETIIDIIDNKMKFINDIIYE